LNTLIQEKIEYLIEYFWDSNEGLIVLNDQNDLVYINTCAQKLLGLKTADNISSIEHCFSFDVCILNEDDIVLHNPILEAVNAKEKFKTESLYQISQDQFKKIIIRSYSIEDHKVLIFSDLSVQIENDELKESQDKYTNKIAELEKDNKEYSTLRERAESQAIRVGLINRISTSIRDTLDTEEIIKTTINEISQTLGVYKGIFAKYDKNTDKLTIKQEWHINNQAQSEKKELEIDTYIKTSILNHTSQISINTSSPELQEANTENSKPRLVVPVIYQGEIFGIILLYHINSKRIWHTEEVSLVEGLCAQVASAIYQASLFEKVENQRKELELTLTQLKEAQTQLIQSEKMASLGKLVAGVAHEINTPIGSISSNIDMLVKYTRKLKEQESDNHKLGSIFTVLDDINAINTEAIRRINTIIKSLRNFARLDEAELKKVDIHEGIQSTLMLINHEIKNRIKIIEEYGNLPAVECYPNLLNQVFMNILVNAYQSIDNEGTITIKTDIKDNKVQITISDTGKGISQENLPKIYDPGFTTKGVGVGTGLGLSICYQIVEKHQGTILVNSQTGLGTVFIVEIPLRQNF